MSNFKIFISDVYDVNNENFIKMMELIKNPNPLNEEYTERHHIIPRFIYRDAKIKIDESDHNIVHLSIKNHILVHYYAAKCCLPKYKWKCLNSVIRTLGNVKLANFENNINEISEQIAETKKQLRLTPMPLDQRMKCSWDHYRFNDIERKEKFGKQAIGNSYRKGCKHTNETREKISKHRTGKSIGHIVDKDTREKIGNANRGRTFQRDMTIYLAVGNFNHYRLAILKTKYTGTTHADWNEFQKHVSSIQDEIVKEIQLKTNKAKKKIRTEYKEEILAELLNRL